MRAELSRVLDVQTERVRSMALSRLDRPHDSAADALVGQPIAGLSRGDVVRRAAQVLADLTADVEGHDRYGLPRLGLHGLGDQLAVVGHDLLDHGDETAWAAGRDVLVELRRAL